MVNIDNPFPIGIFFQVYEEAENLHLVFLLQRALGHVVSEVPEARELHLNRSSIQASLTQSHLPTHPSVIIPLTQRPTPFYAHTHTHSSVTHHTLTHHTPTHHTPRHHSHTTTHSPPTHTRHHTPPHTTTHHAPPTHYPFTHPPVFKVDEGLSDDFVSQGVIIPHLQLQSRVHWQHCVEFKGPV